MSQHQADRIRLVNSRKFIFLHNSKTKVFTVVILRSEEYCLTTDNVSEYDFICYKTQQAQYIRFCVGLICCHHLRRWPNIEPTQDRCLVLARVNMTSSFSNTV